LYTLLVTKGPDLGRSYEIRTSRVSVGTSEEMQFVLTDPAVRPHHFMVMFEEGGWKAITYEPQATILIDRRWQHPRTRQRGARIFVGESQLLLFAGEIDLETALDGVEGADMDAETLREDALTQVADRAFRFRHDMLGKAQLVSDRKDERKPRSDRPAAPQDKPRTIPGMLEAADDVSETVMPGSDGSKLFSAHAGMMRAPALPATIEHGRRAEPPHVEPPKSARASWSASNEVPARADGNRTPAKGQLISFDEESPGATPSSSRELVMLYDRDGTFASNVRILATRVEDLKSRFGYKSFVVSSVGAGEGKTVIASNLAIALSEDSERKIALVDANFRTPRAAELFNLDDSRGLLTALSGDKPLSQCVARVVGRNLVVLHAGGEHKNPAAVIGSARFKALLAELYQAVDFMIIDAPSAVPFADVPLLAQNADAVLMVIATHRTKRSELERAMETIGRNRIGGTIFIDLPKTR
jgi:protein-tyrosine kinase